LGFKIVEQSRTDYAKIKAMVPTGRRGPVRFDADTENV